MRALESGSRGGNFQQQTGVLISQVTSSGGGGALAPACGAACHNKDNIGISVKNHIPPSVKFLIHPNFSRHTRGRHPSLHPNTLALLTYRNAKTRTNLLF